MSDHPIWKLGMEGILPTEYVSGMEGFHGSLMGMVGAGIPHRKEGKVSFILDETQRETVIEAVRRVRGECGNMHNMGEALVEICGYYLDATQDQVEEETRRGGRDDFAL